MDRKNYLELCRECAMLDGNVLDIKQDVPDHFKVLCDGVTYYPYGYELHFDRKGNTLHTAILHDLKANSVTRVRLERVREVEQ